MTIRDDTLGVLSHYRELIDRFRAGAWDPQEFADCFSENFAHDPRLYDTRLYEILNEVWHIAEGFEGNPHELAELEKLTPGFNFGLERLVDACAAAVGKLDVFKTLVLDDAFTPQYPPGYESG
jgi:hypothetical protein